jgi:Flp pilus assembly protein TadG
MRIRRPGSERGAAAVEFALVLPLLITAMLAIIDYGFGFFRQQIVTNAAREGARAGATQPDITSAKSLALTTTNDFLSKGGITGATVTTSQETVAGSDAVRVDIQVAWKSLTGFGLIPRPRNNRAAAVMRLF